MLVLLHTQLKIVGRQQVVRRRFQSSTSSRRRVVGFIGLGNMGLPMSRNLAQNGHQVLAYDINPPPAASDNTDVNMEIARQVQDLATSCSVIFTMLPGCQAVNETMEKLVKAAPPSSSSLVIVDCSTVHPSTSRHWHETWSKVGSASFLDAPVSGGVKGATDGTLTFMVGRSSAEDKGSSLETARPYLQVMGKSVIECGGPGTGAATKLCNNLALAAQMIGVCEALNLGEALGVDPVVLSNVMNTSTAKCWSNDVNNNPHPAVAAAAATATKGLSSPALRDYQGGFATQLMLKDLGLATAAAEQCGLATPVTALSQQLYRLAHAQGLGPKDFGVMLQFLKGGGKS